MTMPTNYSARFKRLTPPVNLRVRALGWPQCNASFIGMAAACGRGTVNEGATFYFTLPNFKETGNGQQVILLVERQPKG